MVTRQENLVGSDVLPAGLGFTGHPLVDVGIAAVTALAEKATPEEVTGEDLRRVAGYLTGLYCSPGALKNFLAGVVFPNSGYVQPAYTDEKRREYAARMFGYYWTSPAKDASRCSFCARPSITLGDRSQIPLLNGVGVVNFAPGGRPGFPICGLCLYAIQAMPLGCLTSGGRLLMATSAQPGLMLAMVRRNVARNRTAFQLAGLEKVPNYQFPRTRLIAELLALAAESDAGRPGSVTAYRLTNSGQSAAVDVFELPGSTVEFLRLVRRNPQAFAAWQRISEAAWVRPKAGRDEPGAAPEEAGRNQLYEDLWRLPDRASRFAGRYFKISPNWELIRLFAKKVLQMEKVQIEALRQLGDQLADYVLERDKMSFFYGFARAKSYSGLLDELLSAGADAYKTKKALLCGYDSFVQAFEMGGTDQRGWRLPRNLIALRMLERLSLAKKPVDEDFEIEPESDQN